VLLALAACGAPQPAPSATTADKSMTCFGGWTKSGADIMFCSDSAAICELVRSRTAAHPEHVEPPSPCKLATVTIVVPP
jgi:hypothetical protein